MQVSIKSYAKKAKHRLGSGFWNEIRVERNALLSENENAEHIKDMYSKRLMHSLYLVENDEDAKLYKKVCKILSSDEFLSNPIGQLIDHQKYDKLDSENKQMYIIKLTDKYNEMKKRFEHERQIHRC